MATMIPPAEDPRPQIDTAAGNVEVWELTADGQTVMRRVEVLNTENQGFAYPRIPDAVEIPIQHGGEVWGSVFPATILEQTESGTYKETTPGRQVMIKRISINNVILDAENNRDAENPLLEIERMQTVGDDVHLLACKEALLDTARGTLYIISKRCSPLEPGHVVVDEFTGTVRRQFTGRALTEEGAKVILRQLLECVVHFHETHGICHADISLGNVLINDENGRIILIDPAMSFRIPEGGTVHHGAGLFGKPAYWLPEILMRRPYRAPSRDLRACIIVLFELLTGQPLYRVPHENLDLAYRFFVWAGGLSTNPINERTRWVMQQAGQQARTRQSLLDEFVRVARLEKMVSNFSPALRELFENTLCVPPESRWSIEQVLNCSWLAGTANQVTEEVAPEPEPETSQTETETETETENDIDGDFPFMADVLSLLEQST